MVLFLRNLPNMELVNAVYNGGTLHNIMLSNSKGEKENEWCSNHGLCDTKTGGVCVTCTAVAYISKITTYHSALQGICSCDAMFDSATTPLPSIVWTSR